MPMGNITLEGPVDRSIGYGRVTVMLRKCKYCVTVLSAPVELEIHRNVEIFLTGHGIVFSGIDDELCENNSSGDLP